MVSLFVFVSSILLSILLGSFPRQEKPRLLKLVDPWHDDAVGLGFRGFWGLGCNALGLGLHDVASGQNQWFNEVSKRLHIKAFKMY